MDAETMDNVDADMELQRAANFESILFAQFDGWIKERIRQLSFEAVASGVFTCTACGEVDGDYIIDYRGLRLEFDAITTYAFLQFLIQQSGDSVTVSEPGAEGKIRLRYFSETRVEQSWQ